jgi:hypothetical protein
MQRREDGYRVDKIVLTTNSGYTPADEGPSESTRAGGTPVTYDWDFGDGGSSTDQNPLYTFTSQGNYIIIVTANDGIEDAKDTIEIIVDFPSNIINTAEKSIKVWIHDAILTINNANAKNITIINILGKVIYRKENAASTTVVDMQNRTKGVYLVKVGNKTWKVVR